jgi:Raf kinase inhibitor-like YbhB/YbcL family protein
MKTKRRLVYTLAVLTAVTLGLGSLTWAAGAKNRPTLKLQSKSFEDGKVIPDKYSCHGQDISPELYWKGAPVKTKSFALIVEDPDAAQMNFTHWVIFNIPLIADPNTNAFELVEGFPRDPKSRKGILQGANDFQKIGYDGPCPPGGTHRYYFKLFALDSFLPLGGGALKSQVVKAMRGHVLAQTQIMGQYGK